MQITILGCGTSAGIPNVAFGWGDCNPKQIKNRRLRSSIFIEVEKERILIDTTPDLREQLLSLKNPNITAILFTHAHADHCHGIDDIRPIVQKNGNPIPAFFSHETYLELEKKFSYIFSPPSTLINQIYPTLLKKNIIEYNTFRVGGVEVTSFKQNHGYSSSTGFRIGNFAYSTDVLELDSKAKDTLKGLDLWIVDALQFTPHLTHSHFEKTLTWIKELKPKRAFLTHLGAQMDYDKVFSICPENVQPAFDGLILNIE